MKKIIAILLSLLLFGAVGCASDGDPSGEEPSDKDTFPNAYAQQAYEQLSLMDTYFREDGGMLSDNSASGGTATLWTYGAYFTAVAKYLKVCPENKSAAALADTALEELEWYKCEGKDAYASDNGKERPVFFDDNAWLVYGLLEMYAARKDEALLDKAEQVQAFIYSGWQEDLGGGLLWREFDKSTTADADFVRNTCINAPAAMCAALLYKYTGEESHLAWAEKIFAWTRDTLKNPSLGTYYDDIDRVGEIGTAQFTYNSGCMLSAASLLYDITKKEEYLSEVRETAEGSRTLFAQEGVGTAAGCEFYSDNPWFRVYLFQGYLDAYRYCGDEFGEYLESSVAGFDYAVSKQYFDTYGFLYEYWNGAQKPDDDSPSYSVAGRSAAGNAQCAATFAEYAALKAEKAEKEG